VDPKARPCSLSRKMDSSKGKYSLGSLIYLFSVNNLACKMFGYNKSELMGRNINIIVPPPWKEYHNSFISKFKGSKGQSKFMGTTRKLFGHHKQGHAFEIMFELKESRDQDRKREFIGLISAIPQTDERVKVISDSKGDILMVSGSIQKAFGYQASDLIGNNVSMLMPESHAAAHHTYLSRYIETGEGKVIGRQARNLVGKGKGEKMFPIVISVEKMEIQKEIFFVAGLWDASNLTGTVYMNGFGLITSVDDQFWYVNLFL
jgi:two-component system sensor kinase FixL